MNLTLQRKVTIGSELPDFVFTWQGVNLETGYTLSATCGLVEDLEDLELDLTVTAVDVGSDSTVTVAVGEGTFDSLLPGRWYEMQVHARRDSDNKDREPARILFETASRIQ